MHSWLDIYPAASGATTPPKQNARVASRLVKLRKTMADLKEKIEIRQQLIGLKDMKGKYCITCGPRPSEPSEVKPCCITCPLQKSTGGWLSLTRDEKAWMKMWEKDVQDFRALSCDVEANALEANMHTVRGWEDTAAYLHYRTVDKHVCQRALDIEPVPGFDEDWTFKEHWGKGPVLEDELAPDEVEKPTEKMAHAEPLGFAEEMDG